MKGFFIGIGSLIAFVGIFYVITSGQSYEHAAAGAHFETFYEKPVVYADSAQHRLYVCDQGPNIIFDDAERKVLVLFNFDDYATMEFDQVVSIPGGVQYRNTEDSFTVNSDDSAFLIINGQRIASDCRINLDQP